MRKLRGRAVRDGGGRAAVLAVLLVVQAVAAVFFVADALADLAIDGAGLHVVLEALVAVALVLGVVFGGLEMGHTLERARRSEAALAVARGALAELIAVHFARWHLTPAEADVALLALKGLDVAGIAALRGAAQGTVRSQLARVYAKAGVSSRAELLSVFIDELLGEPVADGVTVPSDHLPVAVGGAAARPGAPARPGSPG